MLGEKFSCNLAILQKWLGQTCKTCKTFDKFQVWARVECTRAVILDSKEGLVRGNVVDGMAIYDGRFFNSGKN